MWHVWLVWAGPPGADQSGRRTIGMLRYNKGQKEGLFFKASSMHDACRHGQYNFLKFVQKRENDIEWQLCGQKCHVDVRGCHLCQMQTEKWGNNLHCLTKIERKRLEILDFSYNIQMVGSEFGTNNIKAWIHPALCQHSGWCSGVWDIFLANFGPLSKIKWTGYKTCTANLPVNYIQCTLNLSVESHHTHLYRTIEMNLWISPSLLSNLLLTSCTS